MKAYCISGLGADHRVFDTLTINYEKIHLNWIPPLQHESLKEYALRLSEKINTDEDFILIGVSFGGVIAVEISKAIASNLTVLVSSIEKSEELPLRYQLFRKTKLVDILPTYFFSIPHRIASILFGTRHPLLKEILQDSDNQFTKWAIGAILKWENDETISNSLKINGTSDLVLYSKQADHYIKNGHHFMIVDRSEEISEIINSHGIQSQ